MACILLADNSKAIRDTLRRIFLQEGLTFCVEAANGKEAVEEAKRVKPDIVVLAYRMPKMNGLKRLTLFASLLQPRRLSFTVPSILPKLQRQHGVMGANAFVSKAAPGEILLAVRRLVRGRNPIGVRIAPLSDKPPKA